MIKEYRAYSIGMSDDGKFFELRFTDDRGLTGLVRLDMQDVTHLCTLARPRPLMLVPTPVPSGNPPQSPP